MRILILLSTTLFVTSCVTSDSYMKDYNNTNPVKIEEATSGLQMDDIVSTGLDGTIAVRSIELDITHKLDAGIVYMIEDHLISNLLENGHRVLERDPDALSNIYRECSFRNVLIIN